MESVAGVGTAAFPVARGGTTISPVAAVGTAAFPVAREGGASSSPPNQLPKP